VILSDGRRVFAGSSADGEPVAAPAGKGKGK
jgi:hypothetical protein